MSFVESFMAFMKSILAPYSEIPSSTFLIFAVAAALSVITTAANRFLVDVKKMKSVMKEVTAWRTEYNQARKANDKKRLDKAMKKQQAMMKLQSTMMWDRMKVSFIFLAPFWAIFMILSGFFGAKTVAMTPFTVPFLLPHKEMPYYSWYILCSFAVSLPLTRLLGVNPED